MRDPHAVLGVERGASREAIKQAFRQRAKHLHPDANPGDPVAAAAFRDLTQAYALLNDPALAERNERHRRAAAEAPSPPRETSPFGWEEEASRRAWPAQDPQQARRFDPDFPYEEAWGAERPAAEPPPAQWPEEPWTAMEAAGLDPEREKPPAPAADETVEFDLFDELYASPDLGRKQSPKAARHEALDQHYSTTVPFLTAARGGKRRLLLAGGRDVEVYIPAGVEENQVLRFAGLGSANPSGGDAGDALLRVHVEPHPLFRREGGNLLVTVPIGLNEAVLGGSVRVPTLEGAVRAKLPPGLGAKARLKLSGRGLPLELGNRHGPRGDQILELQLVLPKEADPALLAFLADWTPAGNPRASGGFEAEVERLDRELRRPQGG